MKLSNFKLTICLGLCSMSLLSGCVVISKDFVAKGSIDYNETVEKAQNGMLLLNIIRASKRSPMYFTDFQAMRGNLTLNVKGGLSIPFGAPIGSYAGSNIFTPETGFTTNPNFDLILNNSNEFTLGLMKPIKMETFNYYWEQGWPKELLLHLFIRRIEEIDKSGKVKKRKNAKNEIEEIAYNNSPDPDKVNKMENFNNFQEKLRELFFPEKNEKNACTIVGRVNQIGPDLSYKDVADLEKLSKLHNTDLSLKKSGEGENWKLISINYLFDCGGEPSLNAPPEDKENEKCDSPGKCYRIYLRSPEAILYYLGEIVRAETVYKLAPPMIKIHGCKPKPGEAPLFFVDNKLNKNKIAFVKVDYEDEKYIIYRDSAGTDSCHLDRSSHVLSLISQLLGLQRKGEKPPVTGVVTITGVR